MKKILLLLMVLALLLLVACQKNEAENNGKDDEANNPVQVVEETVDPLENVEEVVIEESESKWHFEKIDIGQWTIEAPFINPLCQEAMYSQVDYYDYNELYLDYVDSYASLISEIYYGEVWELVIPFKEEFTYEDNMQLLFDFEDYIEEIGGKVLGHYYDTLAFEAYENKQTWVGQLSVYDSEFTLSLVREKNLDPLGSISFDTADYDGVFYASSYINGDHLYSLEVEKVGGDMSVNMIANSYNGFYTRQYQQALYLDVYNDHVFFDELPYDQGRILWEVTWHENAPDRIQLKLNEIGDIEQVTHGEAMGAIKVSAEYVSSIYAEPTSSDHLYLTHKEYSENSNAMDVTPDGDHIIYVPSGLWDVTMQPSGSALVSDYKTKMVPVNSGQITEVIIPNSVSSKLKVSSSLAEQGLEIRDIVENDQEIAFRFTILDQKTKNILPQINNTHVYEGGHEADVLSIKPVQVPANIVLLLDSSGSMKGQMTATLNAAREFIEKLPDDTVIQVLDFDSKPKLLEGKDKETVLGQLSQVQVGGATTLYDSIIMALNILSDRDRPSIIVFTDGEDANLNDTARGSQADYNEMIKAVENAGISVYTIGFGQGHDRQTLDNIASITGGKYYAAENQEALSGVFNLINEKIINTYDLVYKRPTELSKSDIPVISFVIDTSGSMGEETENGYRLENVKQLLHAFLQALPDDTQYQLTSFNDATSIVQTLTTEKYLIMRGIASLEEGGGTDIEGSVEASYMSLKEIPSSKKVMIYITDAALGASDSSDEFKELLEKIGESDITVLWVGMGVDEYEYDFEFASELSKGSYVISEDPNALKSELDKILQSVIEAPASELVNIFLGVEKVNEIGEREAFSASKLAELSPKMISDEIVLSETIRYEFSDLIKQYDHTTAEKISSESLPREEIVISSRMKAEGVGHNEAAEINVHEIFTLSKMNGVEAPAGYKFIALDLSVENILPAQEVMVYPDNSAHPSNWVAGGSDGKLEMRKIAYQIPNFVSHLYLTYNEKHVVPASIATWLLGQPLIVPGNYSLTVYPDQTEDGLLVFVVPDESLEQMSLHFYDTNYGHIHVPVVGKLSQPFELEELPTEVATNLNETFGLAVSSYEYTKEISDILLDNASSFEQVKGNFTSNMQALIDINPADRIQMQINTENGNFYIPISPATVLVPGGFYQPRMLAPGAQNYVTCLFQVPDIIKDHASQLFVDLSDGDKFISIHEGPKLAADIKMTLEHEYFNIHINDYMEMASFRGNSGRYVLMDITVEDLEDGFSTSGIGSMFLLKPESETVSKGLGNFAGDPNGLLTYAHETENMILGFSDDTIVYDGSSRRGFILFYMYDEQKYTLVSSIFQDLDLEIPKKDYKQDYLVDQYAYVDDTNFENSLSEAIGLAVERYRLKHPEEDERLTCQGLDSSQIDIAPPMISIYGSQLMDSIESVDDLLEILKTIQCIPSAGGQDIFEYNLSPEALLIQKYGTEQDIAGLAFKVLAKLGYSPKLHTLKLTAKGKALYEKMTGFEVHLEDIPGIQYNDGQSHLLMIPFNVFNEDVKDIAHIHVASEQAHYSSEIYMEVSLIGEYTEKGVSQQFADFSNALSGDTQGENLVEISMYSDSIPMDHLSLDAIDFGIGVAGQKARFYMSTPGGEVLGDEVINPDHYDFKEMIVKFTLPNNQTYTHVSRYSEEMNVDEIFMTASINAPDLDQRAYQHVLAFSDDLYESGQPTPYAALRWYGRRMILQMNYNQNLYDLELADQLDLSIGHTLIPKIYVVSNRLIGDSIDSNIDLLQGYQTVFKGQEKAIKSFNIMSGLYMSTLEGDVINNGYGVEDVWAALPDDTDFIMLDYYLSEEMIEYLSNLGMTEEMIKHFNESYTYVLIPTKPAIINGHERWAWLEMDESYKTIGVLDDFSKGASVESVIVDTVKNAGQFALGAFKGVESSIWSVAAFSLEESDYQEILKKAKAFTLAIADSFGAGIGPISGSIGGTISASQSVGPVNFSYDGSFSASQGVLGYKEGFIEGVNLYFDIAK